MSKIRALLVVPAKKSQFAKGSLSTNFLCRAQMMWFGDKFFPVMTFEECAVHRLLSGESWRNFTLEEVLSLVKKQFTIVQHSSFDRSQFCTNST